MGLSGQSLHTQLNQVPYQFAEKTQISNKTVDQLKEINNGVVYPNAEILDVVPQEYRIGNHLTTDPVGVQCEHVEARFLNVVARKGISENIERCVKNAGFDVAEILISPICLADSLIPVNEKRSGCALADIGAETTTVSIYTNNILRKLIVIPLGGNNVNIDITTKGVEQNEAEQLKLKYGTAWHEGSEEPSNKKIALSFGNSIIEEDLQNIIEARYEEIIANIWAQIAPFQDKLLSGLLLTGNASKVKNLTQAITEYSHCDKQIRLAKGTPENISLASNVHVADSQCLYTLMSLLLKGDQNCVGEEAEDEEQHEVQGVMDFSEQATEEENSTTAETPDTTEAQPEAESKEETTIEEPKKKKSGMGNTMKKIWGIINDMLKEPEEEDKN